MDNDDGIPTTRRQWVDLDAESLSHDTAYLERLYTMGKYGIPTDKTLKSPVSPTNGLEYSRKASIFYKDFQELLPSESEPVVVAPIDEKKSRNSIFELPQSVLKPATKMTLEELESLKQGKTDFSVVNVPSKEGERKSSVTVPIKLTLQGNRPDPRQSLFDQSSFNSTSQPYYLTSEFPNATLAGVAQAPLPALPTITDFSISKNIDILKLDTKIATSSASLATDRLSLIYMPVAKNLLGEGRYAQVFRGQYSPDCQPEELPSNTTATPTETSAKTSLYECAVKRVFVTEEAQLVAYNEAMILRRISRQHPNIIRLIGVLDEAAPDSPRSTDRSSQSRLLLVLELLPKGNLREFTLRNKQHLGRKLFMKWAKQLASALHCIHTNGIVHHDIKPHNIMLTDLLDIRISDFGNACYVPEAKSPQSPDSDITLSPESVCLEPGVPSYSNSQSLEDGIGRGTLAYTAPELVHNRPYTFSVDVYSLGVTLYSLISGLDPFTNAKTNIQIIMGIKRGFFASGMQPEWNGRYLNGEHMDPKIMDLIQTMVELEPSSRPTARRVLEVLEKLDF